MFTQRQVTAWALLVGVTSLALAQAPQAAKPLAEDRVARLVELKIKDEVIASMIQKQGLGFTADDQALERLKKAGASEAVLEAVRKAGQPTPKAVPIKALTYQEVVELMKDGVPEEEIIARLRQSPTTFTLSTEQVEELKKLGATERLLGEMKEVRASLSQPGNEITDFVIALDCSGSMIERTPEGPTKMEVAKQAVSDLVREVADGVRLAFVVYGHDKTQECNAVKVVRPMSPLDPKGKNELLKQIAALQPSGATPIALALRTAGVELARTNAPSGLLLISDGKETCRGNPVSEAATLARSSKLRLGVNVVGFDIKAEEEAGLKEIAAAGKGKYYAARDSAALRGVVQILRQEIVAKTAPAPEGPRVAPVRRGQARFVTVQRPAIQLPPLGGIYLAEAESNSASQPVVSCTQYGQKMRIPPVNKDEMFDVWWVPKDKVSMRVKMVANLAVGGEEVVVKPEEHLGLVRLTGKDLPATKQVFLGPPNYGQEVARFVFAHKIQKANKYGQDLVIASGTYNLWIDPVDEKEPEVVAEKLEVKAGRVTVIE